MINYKFEVGREYGLILNEDFITPMFVRNRTPKYIDYVCEGRSIRGRVYERINPINNVITEFVYYSQEHRKPKLGDTTVSAIHLMDKRGE